MRKALKIGLLAVLALPALAIAESRQGCDLVNFSKEVLAKFPNAQHACQDVREKNGGIYVHYIAEVLDVTKDTITVHIIGHDGKPVSKTTFAPAADQRLDVEGKEVMYSDLKKGMKVDFYIEHAKWGLYAKPDGKRLTILSQENL